MRAYPETLTLDNASTLIPKYEPHNWISLSPIITLPKHIVRNSQGGRDGRRGRQAPAIALPGCLTTIGAGHGAKRTMADGRCVPCDRRLDDLKHSPVLGFEEPAVAAGL